MPTITSSIQHCPGAHSQCIKTRKKWHKAWKGRNKFLGFFFQMIELSTWKTQRIYKQIIKNKKSLYDGDWL